MFAVVVKDVAILPPVLNGTADVVMKSNAAPTKAAVPEGAVIVVTVVVPLIMLNGAVGAMVVADATGATFPCGISAAVVKLSVAISPVDRLKPP